MCSQPSARDPVSPPTETEEMQKVNSDEARVSTNPSSAWAPKTCSSAWAQTQTFNHKYHAHTSLMLDLRTQLTHRPGPAVNPYHVILNQEQRFPAHGGNQPSIITQKNSELQKKELNQSNLIWIYLCSPPLGPPLFNSCNPEPSTVYSH